jgi:hypothetical protein
MYKMVYARRRISARASASAVRDRSASCLSYSFFTGEVAWGCAEIRQ